MKIFLFLLIFHLLLSSPSTSSFINKIVKASTYNNLKNKQNFSTVNNVSHKNNKKRLLASNDDGFKQIRIFVDKTYINKQKTEVESIYDKVMTSLDKCINIIQKLIRVKPKDKIKFSDTDIAKLQLNSNDIDPFLLPNNPGKEADLVIFPKFITSDSLIALGKPEILDTDTNRPIGAILSFNKILPLKPNNQDYLESIILHQLTHILGFTYGMFNNFEGGLARVIKTETETRTNYEKKFIITPKVIDYAKKYFNCPEITGVELENEGGYDGYTNSHWEARILLGEYMNSEINTPEQAISGFTLALLEDSGWYKVNYYYTGGLMRFGKNQGCDFLFKDCEVSDKSKNKFKNDLFTIGLTNNIFMPTCTSGRQSRSYNVVRNGFYRQMQLVGKKIADYCFVSDLNEDEENEMFYVGSCHRGGDEYGIRIVYNTINPNEQSKNGDIPEIFGEKISSNSFCVLSSAIPIQSKIDITQYNKYKNIIHPMCYPMFCSSKSLTIQIYNQYIVCPRQGGIVEINGDFEGHVYCPDYNLICTGSVLCNDMFDCVEKNSLEKDESFIYDYDIKTSQETIKEIDLSETDITIGYELSNNDDSQCPEHCSQCKENKKCFICEPNYKLIGSRENDENPIICSQTNELSNYYKNDNDNTYYLCMDNCLSCPSINICNNCDLKYKLKEDQSNCEEKIPHCKNFDTNYEFCEECDEEYYLLNDDKSNCHNEVIDHEKYFTEDEGKTYISCEETIINCIKCDRRDFCIVCKDGYKFDQENIICNLKIPHCKTFDSNFEFCVECDEGYYLINEDKEKCYNKNDEPIDEEKYFTEDEGKTYTNCQTAIENCLKCDNRNYCNLCKDGYLLENENKECNSKIPHCKAFDSSYEFCVECDEGYYLKNEDKTICHNKRDEPIDEEKYFTEDEGKIYINCEQTIENCLKCNGRHSCTQCINTHKIEQNGALCNPKIPNCKTFDSNYEFCEECEEGYYIINKDFKKCHNEPINDKYFTENNGIIYFSCDQGIQNCLKCKNRNYCIICKEGYIIADNNSLCSLINDPNIQCYVNTNSIDDKDINFLQKENIDKLIQDYIINNNKNKDLVEHYYNNIYNYSITIFRNSECTSNLLSLGEYYLNTTNILLLYSKEYFINCFISYNYKNYISFYNNNGKEIDMGQECPNCLEMKYNLKNNFSDEFLDYYSPLLIDKIQEKEIDVFSTENEILNDKCDPFEFGGINIPIKLRENIFFNNENTEGIICTDPNCIIKSQNLDELTAECECLINYELNYLFEDIYNFNNTDNIESDNSAYSTNIFSCLFKNMDSTKLFQNFAFYFTTSCAIIEVISFLFYAPFKQTINLQKYSPKNNEKPNEDNDGSKNLDENDEGKNQTNALEKENNNNNIPTEENIRPSVISSIEKFTSNPPPRNSILYKYKWFKNKPKILSLENSHDEDLDIQSRDEADPENEIRRKIKNFSFFDKNSSVETSYLEDSLSDNRDKITETSKNRITLVSEDKNKKIIIDKIEDKKEKEDNRLTSAKPKKEFEILDYSPKRSEKIQTLKTNLPQVLTREENARKKKRFHSIKNIPRTVETYPKKDKEEKQITLIDIYIKVLCIKQHIINFFSCLFKNCLDAESFIPLQMKIIRFIFMIILNIFFNTVFLNQNYFIKKYNYFNDKYNLEKSAEKDLIISTNDKVKYAFSHCIGNAFISFIICLFIQFIIGIIFFGTKKKIDNIIENKQKITQEKEYNTSMYKIKCLFIIFFIINFVLVIILSFYVIGFNMIYDKSIADFLIPTFVTFLLLQIIPFLISIVIALIMFKGLKKDDKKLINIAKTCLF